MNVFLYLVFFGIGLFVGVFYVFLGIWFLVLLIIVLLGFLGMFVGEMVVIWVKFKWFV